ncbi:hypothetical protein EYF80_050209 [Liparis tanakae]|uniref:Uncharacterized protein n=1 Tax=Liparis tanakae TaxID=230148 RepID=A0A4Z2FFD5_9TELE|nr:hypothetical protein EYF80_050209 [Liparis tanakae]
MGSSRRLSGKVAGLSCRRTVCMAARASGAGPRPASSRQRCGSRLSSAFILKRALRMNRSRLSRHCCRPRAPAPSLPRAPSVSRTTSSGVRPSRSCACGDAPLPSSMAAASGRSSSQARCRGVRPSSTWKQPAARSAEEEEGAPPPPPMADEAEDEAPVVAHGHGQVRRGGGRAAAEALPGPRERLVGVPLEQVARVRLVVVDYRVEQRLRRRVRPVGGVLLPVERLHGAHVLQHPDRLQVPHGPVEEQRAGLAVLLEARTRRRTDGERAGHGDLSGRRRDPSPARSHCFESRGVTGTFPPGRARLQGSRSRSREREDSRGRTSDAEQNKPEASSLSQRPRVLVSSGFSLHGFSTGRAADDRITLGGPGGQRLYTCESQGPR